MASIRWHLMVGALWSRRNSLVAAIGFATAVSASWWFASDTPPKIAALATIACLTFALWRARTDRTAGYYWLLPAGPFYVVIAFAVQGRNHGALLVAALGMIAVGLALHIGFAVLTATWVSSIAGGGVIITASLIAIDQGSDLILQLQAVSLPLVAVPVIAANSSRRTALAAAIAMPILSSMVLIGIAVTDSKSSVQESPCPDPITSSACVFESYPALARDGFRLIASEVTGGGGVTIIPPANDRSFVIVVLGYLYLCYLVMRFNSLRMRSVVQVKAMRLDGEASSLTGIDPPVDLLRVLVSGSVVVGDPHSPAMPSPVIDAVAASPFPSRWVGLVSSMFRAKFPVRAHLTTESGGASLRIDNGTTGKTVLSETFGAIYLADEKVSAEEQAGYSLLAYCLGARGMPAWSTWHADGQGLAAWAVARRLRRGRWATADGGELDLSRPAATEGIDEEIDLLRRFREREPDALLLGLELGSRFYECGRYAAAFRVYQGCARRYPQFPECWIRVSYAADAVAEQFGKRDFNLTTWDADVRDHFASESGPMVGPDSVRLAAAVPDLSSWYQLRFPALAPEQTETDPLGGIAFAINLALGGPAGLRNLPIVVREAVAEFFALLALAASRRARRRLYRPALLARAICVQSERTFFWNLIFSRFGVRHLSATARTLELATLVRLQGFNYCRTTDIRSLTRATRSACDREGTGWRCMSNLAVMFDGQLRSSVTDLPTLVDQTRTSRRTPEQGRLIQLRSQYLNKATTRGQDELAAMPWNIEPRLLSVLEDTEAFVPAS